MKELNNCPQSKQSKYISMSISLTRYLRAIIIVFLSIYFLIIPSMQIIRYLYDPGLINGSMCSFLYHWHQDLSSKYEVWARQRLVSDEATQLTIENISGTEWPLFGSVFYLWATEALQAAWEEDHSLSNVAPAEYAKGAIEASTALVVDPAHASWVKVHWGDEYLEKENLFYRMLLIHAMTTYQQLLDDTRYESQLTQQVNSLAEELDASPYGLLDDYPGQCYPVDILPAYVGIQRADKLLGLDHSEILARGIRAFQENRLDSTLGLPSYNVDSETGYNLGPARGVGMSFMLMWAPEIWPETSKEWYQKYTQHFWQETRLLKGFREFERSDSVDRNWVVEVDAGPVLAGYGMGASAFGIGAARANGRMDHAYPLSSLALIGAWRLPDGTLPIPRLLSDLIDAPYLGEAALLFSLTRRPITPVTQKTNRNIPLLVWLVTGTTIIIGLLLSIRSIVEIKRIRTGTDPYVIQLAGLQLAFRGLLLLFAVFVFASYGGIAGQIASLIALIFPYIQKKKSPKIKKELM